MIEFKQVSGFSKYYVTSLGDVLSFAGTGTQARVLRPSLDSYGYETQATISLIATGKSWKTAS